MDQNCYYTINGFIIHNLSEVPPNAILQKHFRLCGGKGGFGSMLRAIGSQIEKTTNREMCRDLNGRRMRDVNNEKRLKEWLDSTDSREREKLESYLEKRRKRKLLLEQGPSAKLPFEEKSAEEQRKQIAEELQDAINEAFEHRKILETKVKVEVKPKKIGFNVDSDIESSSSSSSSPISSINIEENYILQNLDNNNMKSNAQLDVNEEIVDSDDDVLDIDHTKLNASLDANIQIVESDDDKTIQNATSTFSEKIPSKKIKLDAEQVIPEAIIESTAKITDSLKEITFSPIDLNTVGSVNHLLTYGSDWIKHDLMRRGLKCGGTLMERTQRLFSVKGLVEYPSNLLAGFVKNKRK